MALLGVLPLLLGQVVSVRHVIASAHGLGSGEALVCSQFGATKVSIDFGVPSKQDKEVQSEHCPICGGVAAPLVLLAGLALGVFDAPPRRLSPPLVYASLRDASPDRRHAPPTAPPSRS